MNDKIHPVPENWKRAALIDAEAYRTRYAAAARDPDGFWAQEAQRIDWITPFTKVKHTSFDPHNVSIKWFEDGATNVAMNCIDRHLVTRPDKIAIIWEGDDPTVSRHITYRELHEEVCRFANVLRNHGVRKGD
jgi:acetyl-CoA synthetase